MPVAALTETASTEVAERMSQLEQRFRAVLPMTQDNLVHMPIWVLQCSRTAALP